MEAVAYRIRQQLPRRTCRLKNVSRKKEDLSFVPCAVVYMENPAGPKEVPNQWVTHGMRYEKQWSMAPIHVYVLDSR